MCVVLYSIGIKIKWQQNYIVIITNNILKFRQRPNEINTATEEVLNKKNSNREEKIELAVLFPLAKAQHSTISGIDHLHTRQNNCCNFSNKNKGEL